MLRHISQNLINVGVLSVVTMISLPLLSKLYCSALRILLTNSAPHDVSASFVINKFETARDSFGPVE